MVVIILSFRWPGTRFLRRLGGGPAVHLTRLTGKARPWLWWVGFFTFQAVVHLRFKFRASVGHCEATLAALVIGFFLYYRNLIYYWNYNVTWRHHLLDRCDMTIFSADFEKQEMRSYTNVAAAQDDAARHPSAQVSELFHHVFAEKSCRQSLETKAFPDAYMFLFTEDTGSR